MTIGDRIAENETLYVNCSDPRCQHSTKLDLVALAARMGNDHGAMHDDLMPLFRCGKCQHEGRPRSRPFLTCVPDYGRSTPLPMPRRAGP